MANLNLLMFLNAYSDSNPTNSPSRNNFKWNRSVNGLSVANPYSLEFTLAPGETRPIFSGTRTLTQDNTTQYSIALKPFTTNTYVLSWTGGAAPSFRTLRALGINATTTVTVTLNGTVATFSAQSMNTAAVQIGDYLSLGSDFNLLNQGQWQVISKTSTSVSVVNASAAAEGPILLGSDYATQFRIYSAAGVQVGDVLNISGGFSPVSQGNYVVTLVTDSTVEFVSTALLPQEGPITTQAIAFYTSAKRLIYIEADQKCAVTINGSLVNNIEPIVNVTCGCPTNHGFLLLTSTVYSLSVTNNGLSEATLYLASVE